MNEQIAAILAEANLSEEQVQKIAGICQEAVESDRAVLRAAHLDEVASLTEANKAELVALTTALVEARRLNTTVEMVVGESKLVLDKRRGVSISVVAEGKTYTQLVSKAFVAEAKKMCADSADGDADDKGEGDEELDEGVKATPRRVVAKKGEAQAVGIDLDQGGTLAFTVSTIDGSAAVELSKPDSDAVKAWFSSLQESDAMDDEEEEKGEELEEAGDFMSRFETFAGGEVKPGRVTIKGFPVDLNDTDGTYMDIDAVDADAAAGLAKELKKGGFKVKRAGKTGLLVERNGKAVDISEAQARAEALAASILESALEPLIPVLREARLYEKVKGQLIAIQEAMVNAGIIVSAPVQMVSESKEDEVAELNEKVSDLQTRLDAANALIEESAKKDLFAEKTKDMALTTTEKVRALVEAAAPKSVDEYTAVLEAAVSSVTAAKAPASAKTNLVESSTGAKDDGRMAAYVSML